MKINLVLPLFCLLLYLCESHKKEYHTSNTNIDSDCISIDSSAKIFAFHYFWGIDSIVKSNYAFIDSIDTISISRHVFEAKYLTAHKGRANIQRFDFLKTSNPAEYNIIAAIHTAHALVIGEEVFSFNGKGDVKHSKIIPESTNVIVAVSVYSFYSKGVCLGRHIILDSIQTVVNSQEKNQPITFPDGETLSVRTNFYTDNVIDSILIKKRTFEAVYKNCEKGILNLNLFSILKQQNRLEYKLLEDITTAHAININERHYYFNGKNSIDIIPDRGTPIRVNATIYSLFSGGKHKCNILIFDTIHQLRKNQPQ